MPITLYHNPKCSKSRETLALIRAQGIEPQIVEYLKTPLTSNALQQLVARSQQPVRHFLRQDTPYFAQISPEMPDEAIFALIVAHPELLNRPIVASDKGVALCRPPETVFALL